MDINKAFTWAVQTCNAPNTGYSQTYRNQKTVNGITYYDCSSFINYALIAGGFSTPGYAPDRNAFTTATMIPVLLSIGFKEIDSHGEILPGDIGVIYDSTHRHTEMCYRGGFGTAIFMGAHAPGLPLADQVSINKVPTTFPRIFRYGSGGAITFGSSIYVISALCGNAWKESHINPILKQKNGTAFGLFQWDGGRRDALFEWCVKNGKDRKDPIAQLTYLTVEPDPWIGTHYGISSLEDFLTSTSTSIEDLTAAFCYGWERPGVPDLPERIRFARLAFNFIKEHAQDTNINQWETYPEYYLSEGKALQNAVLIYRFFSAGGGGGGTKRKRNTPIWMMLRYK